MRNSSTSVWALASGRLLAFSYGEVACFNCTILSRNSPTALAIAVVAFPDEPLIALALVVGPLLELQKCEEKAPPFRAGMNPTDDDTNHRR